MFIISFMELQYYLYINEIGQKGKESKFRMIQSISLYAYLPLLR